MNNLSKFRNISIKHKLTLIIMASTTVALLLISGAFVTYESMTFQKSMRSDLSTLAEIIGKQNDVALSFERSDEIEKSLAALSAKPHIVRAGIYNQAGKLSATYPKGISRELLPRTPEREGFRVERGDLLLFHGIVDNGETIGTIFLESDLGEQSDRMARYGAIILLFMLASSVITFFISSSLQRVISGPVSHLAQTARAVSSEKNYSLRAVKQSQDELGQFIDVFNEMLTQIQERDAALQQAHDKLEKRVAERTRDLESEISGRREAQEALQRQLTRSSLLNKIMQVISERQDIPSILQVVLRHLEDHLSVDMGWVCLLEGKSDVLTIAASQQRRPDKWELQSDGLISLEGSGLTWCRRGETVYLRDTGAGDSGLAHKLKSAGMNCAVAVPLMVEGGLFGILLVARSAADSFSNGECEFLRVLSEHVALAAHQAQLHAELEAAYNDLRQTQQAVMQQDRLRALGQMASGIAHDVNNALSPVVGFAGLLLSYEPGLSQMAKKHLNYIKTAGEDVAHIVARLREFYRQREGQEPLFTINLNQLAGQVIDMTRPRWRDIPQGRGIMVEMRTDLAVDLPEMLGTASEIREALTNLVLNAVDAMPKGGTLTLRTRAMGLAPGSQVGGAFTHAIVEVLDTGIGMSEETRKQCLEPFFSTKGKRGTGMGLAMVYGVMERHEGKIEVESELNKGTTMRLIFPLRAQTINPNDASGEETPAPTSLHILCIDDEPLLRELVKEILEHDGHQVEAADSGQTGLDAFHQAATRGGPFDVVITDLGMPHLDGGEVAKILKTESAGTPVIMLTGWGAFMKSDGDVPAHVDGILSKPPRMKELREMLVRLTRKEKVNSADQPAPLIDVGLKIPARSL